MINLEKYFISEDNEYYDPRIIITILMKYFGKDFESLKNSIENMCVFVTSDQITKYLNNVFDKENPEIKQRIENRKKIRNDEVLFGETQLEYIKNDSGFEDYIVAKKYQYYPYTLEYFKKYIEILKTKLRLLLNIIDQLSNKKSNDIEDILENLDISPDEYGNISGKDIIRLVLPIIYNIETLESKVETSNDLATYLSFKMSLQELVREGISENEIYPDSTIQVKNIDNDCRRGNVPLSENQKQLLSKKQDESAAILVNSLFS